MGAGECLHELESHDLGCELDPNGSPLSSDSEDGSSPS